MTLFSAQNQFFIITCMIIMIKILSVYSEYYKIAWKIDIYDIRTKELIERKTQIFTFDININFGGKCFVWKKCDMK